MSEFIRCQRQRVGKFAAIGLMFVLIPAAGGAVILAVAEPGIIAWSAATTCFLIACFFAYPTLRMFHWVETDGRIVRGKRFWTRFTVELPVEELAEFRAGLGQFADRGRDPALGVIRPYNYQLMFRDRTFVYLACHDMCDTDAFVEKIVREPGTGLSVPAVLGGARLGGYVHYGAPAMGRSYAYYGQGHLTITVYVYPCEDGVADGIESQRLKDEFEEVKTIVSDMRGPTDGQPPEGQTPAVTVQAVGLGEAADAPKALCGTFEFEVDNERVESRLYLTGWRNHFIKMRCTMPASYRNAWGPGLARFEMELGKMLMEEGT